VIDACVFRLPGGIWRMWYKDEPHQSHTYTADSPDLEHWREAGPAISDYAHEGPNVFAWQGAYRSDDLAHWTRQADILDAPGNRPDDSALGHHADMLVQGERAYIFYFTHPGVTGIPGADFEWDYAARRTSIQAAELEIEGGQLVYHRDKNFEMQSEPEEI
jgi:hypothetical protein